MIGIKSHRSSKTPLEVKLPKEGMLEYSGNEIGDIILALTHIFEIIFNVDRFGSRNHQIAQVGVDLEKIMPSVEEIERAAHRMLKHVDPKYVYDEPN